jgi:hypothetical protein
VFDKRGPLLAEPTMGEMSRSTYYQRFIAEHVCDTDAR